MDKTHNILKVEIDNEEKFDIETSFLQAESGNVEDQLERWAVLLLNFKKFGAQGKWTGEKIIKIFPFCLIGSKLCRMKNWYKHEI